MKVTVHLAAGIGNVVLATPLLLVLYRAGHALDLVVDGDYARTSDLLAGWSAIRRIFSGAQRNDLESGYEAVIPAIPPFYWQRYRALYKGAPRLVSRPPDALFYEDEQRYYLDFARRLGCDVEDPPYPFLPIQPLDVHGIHSTTLVIAPGCKTGEMAAKRWPYFAELAEAFSDVAVVGTADDLRARDGSPLRLPGHVRSFIDRLTIRQTGEVMAAAAAVVANDSGLAHVAAAVGVPTVVLFGPTPDRTLGRRPPNVEVLRAGLPCEPCWFGRRFAACQGSIACMGQIKVDTVVQAVRRLIADPTCAAVACRAA